MYEILYVLLLKVEFLFIGKNTHYLNFVVLPQGVRGYLMDFARPPWG